MINEIFMTVYIVELYVHALCYIYEQITPSEGVMVYIYVILSLEWSSTLIFVPETQSSVAERADECPGSDVQK